jgi:hypothetical protein
MSRNRWIRSVTASRMPGSRANGRRSRMPGSRANPTPALIPGEPVQHLLQVRAALNDGAFALVILGGAHDLTESVRRRAGAPCEYLRVAAQCYREFAGEE